MSWYRKETKSPVTLDMRAVMIPLSIVYVSTSSIRVTFGSVEQLVVTILSKSIIIEHIF